MAERTAILHVGSISSWTRPAARRSPASRSGLHARRHADQRRPQHPADAGRGPVGETLGNTAAAVRARLDRLVALADIVKVSSEDLAWLEPDVRRAR